MKYMRRFFLFTFALLMIFFSDTQALAEKTSYYSELSKIEKASYRIIKKELEKADKKKILDVKVKCSEKSVYRVVDAIAADLPYYFDGSLHVTTYKLKSGIRVELGGILPAKEARALKTKAAELDLRGDNDVTTLYNIHNWLIDNVDYHHSKDETVYSMVGAVNNGKAVCEGYARSFKYLCDLHEIPCVLVTGKGVFEFNTERHMWNYVMVDGIWYAVDTTWDDTMAEDGKRIFTYFLVGSKTKGPDGSTFDKSHIEEKDFMNFDFDDMKIKGFAFPKISKEAHSYHNDLVLCKSEEVDCSKHDIEQDTILY